jgi:bacterioferritin
MDKLIEMLNEAMRAEHQAAYQYMNHYNNVRGKFPTIVDHFKDHMDDEIGHANELAQRIYTLGGTPDIEMKPVADFTDDVDEALKQDIVGEQEAIDLYSDILKYCEETGDMGTTMMIEGILATEVAHIDEFAKLKGCSVTRS